MSDFAIRTVFKAQDKQFRSSVNKLDRQMNKFGKTADKAFRRASRGGKTFRDIVKGILTANIIQTGFRQVKNLFGFIFGQTARMETAVATFTGLFKSAEKATKFVKDLQTLSTQTTFSFTGLEESAKILLKWNPEMQELIPTLKMLGDLAQGDADKLQTITTAYAKILSRGQVQADQLNSLAEDGIPIWDLLQKKFNATGRFARETIENLVGAGRLSSQELILILNELATGNTKFVDSTKRQASTLGGVWDSLLKEIGVSATKLGEILSPTVKEILKSFKPLLDGFNEWLATTELLSSANVLAAFEKFKEIIVDAVDTFSPLMKFLGSLSGFISQFQGPSSKEVQESVRVEQEAHKTALAAMDLTININDPTGRATVETPKKAPLVDVNILR